MKIAQYNSHKTSNKKQNQYLPTDNLLTKFGDIPRATVEPPTVYSNISAHPIIQATLEKRRMKTYSLIRRNEQKQLQGDIYSNEWE